MISNFPTMLPIGLILILIIFLLIYFGEKSIKKNKKKKKIFPEKRSIRRFREANLKISRKYSTGNAVVLLDDEARRIGVADSKNDFVIYRFEDVEGYEIVINGGIIYKKSKDAEQNKVFENSINKSSFMRLSELRSNMTQIENIVCNIYLPDVFYSIRFFDIWEVNKRNTSDLARLGKIYKYKIRLGISALEGIHKMLGKILNGSPGGEAV